MTTEFPPGMLPRGAASSSDSSSAVADGLASLLGPECQSLMYRWASPELVGSST